MAEPTPAFATGTALITDCVAGAITSALHQLQVLRHQEDHPEEREEG